MIRDRCRDLLPSWTLLLAAGTLLTGCPSLDSPVFRITVRPADGGTVTDGSATCQATCVWERERGPRTFTAVPADGFQFVSWSGGCGNTSGAVCAVQAAHNTETSIIATFAAVAAPQVTSQPTDQTVSEQATAQFSATATGTPPLSYQWFRSDDGQNFGPMAGGTDRILTLPSVAATDNGARFRVVVSNVAGSVTSAAARLTVLAEVCPVPPRDVPFDLSTPPTVTPPAAVLGANTLVDGGFSGTVRVGTLPTGLGYWRFDAAVSVANQQGITARSAPSMLNFVAGGQVGVYSGTASEMVQLTDVSALSALIDAGELQVTAEAWFNRVVGCALTDDSFGVQIVAYDGDPSTFPVRQSAGVTQATEQGVSRDVAVVTGSWLRHRTGALVHDTPGTWRRASATMDVPAGTRFFAIVVYAVENRSQDAVFPEFHGHYADDASVVLSRKP